MKVHNILSSDETWLYGETEDTETGVVTQWSKLTENAYDRMFWFLHTPKHYFAENYKLDIDAKTSDALENLLEEKWIDFCYLVSIFTGPQIEEVIKLFLGPIAQHSKETKTRPLNCISVSNLEKLIRDSLSFNEKKNIIMELMASTLPYEEIRKKHVFEGIPDDVIEGTLRRIIAANATQWAKAKESPNLMNWFVGQVMKEYKGKINAANVMAVLNSLKETE